MPGHAHASPEELRGFNGILSHRPTANPDTPKESTRARGDIKPTFLQKELAKFVHTAPKYPKNTWAWLALPVKGLYRGFTDPAKSLCGDFLRAKRAMWPF